MRPHAHYLPNAQPFFLEQSLEIILMIWVAKEKLVTVCSHLTVDLPTREYAGRGVTGEKSTLDPSPGSLRNQKDLVTVRFPSVKWPHSKDPRNRDKQDFDSPYTPKSVHTGV